MSYVVAVTDALLQQVTEAIVTEGNPRKLSCLALMPAGPAAVIPTSISW